LTLNVMLVRRIGPLVAGLPATSARITARDAFRIQVTAYPYRSAIIFALIDLTLFVLFVANAMFGTRGWDLYAVVGAVLFGAGMIYFAALCIAKRRQAAA
jgi:hypothetical protein